MVSNSNEAVHCQLNNPRATNKAVVLSIDKGLEQDYDDGAWVTVLVPSDKYVKWYDNKVSKCYGNFDALNPSKLANLASLLTAQRGSLAISCLHGIPDNQYQFANGRHRAYWLATAGGCELVPLRISAQYGDALFTEILSS